MKRNETSYQANFCLVEASLDELKQQKQEFLDDRELMFFANLRYERRQLSYLLGRLSAKLAVADYFGVEQLKDNFVLENGVLNHPVVISKIQPNTQVSLSHSHFAGVALAFPEAHPMGIDLEYVSDQQLDTIQSQLTLHEKRLLSELDDSAMLMICHSLWTSREALSKILKTGLMVSPETLSIQKIQKLSIDGTLYKSEFMHFFQYQSYSFQFGEYLCSIVSPKHTDLSHEIQSIQSSCRTGALSRFVRQ